MNRRRSGQAAGRLSRRAAKKLGVKQVASWIEVPAAYEYPPENAATRASIRATRCGKTSVLRRLLSKEHYQRLLELYEREVSASGTKPT